MSGDLHTKKNHKILRDDKFALRIKNIIIFGFSLTQMSVSTVQSIHTTVCKGKTKINKNTRGGNGMVLDFQGFSFLADGRAIESINGKDIM